ncbi:unnamed protein product [Sphagnum jensenii]|uniref:HIT-type domain-containing protein n=1 Tax=Sphagnum jensenii TaxID=128206 RepID=A0ABP0VN83_9BRYO
MIMGKQCGICNNAESKYKCPCCLIPYCSVTCYQQHKEIPCVKPEPAASSDGKSFICLAMHAHPVCSSYDIRRMLRDQDLQSLIRKIDSAVNAEEELDKAMEGPAFREFADKILATINPEEHVLAAES